VKTFLEIKLVTIFVSLLHVSLVFFPAQNRTWFPPIIIIMSLHSVSYTSGHCSYGNAHMYILTHICAYVCPSTQVYCLDHPCLPCSINGIYVCHCIYNDTWYLCDYLRRISYGHIYTFYAMYCFYVAFQGWCHGSLIYSCFFYILHRLVSRVTKHRFHCTLLFHFFLLQWILICPSLMTYKILFAFRFTSIK
jgi:hypothetical protein